MCEFSEPFVPYFLTVAGTVAGAGILSYSLSKHFVFSLFWPALGPFSSATATHLNGYMGSILGSLLADHQSH